MEILNISDINDALTLTEVKPTQEAISSDLIEQIKKSIDLKPDDQPGKGKCLLNAYKVAEITNAEIVEGTAFVEVKAEGDELSSTSFIKHAWNRLNGDFFDVTRDLVWPNSKAKLIQCEYRRVNIFDLNDYQILEDNVEFKSNSNQIAISLNYIYTKENVLMSLDSFGLSFNLREQLLLECSSLLKKDE